MLLHCAKRLGWTLVTLWLATCVTFALLHLAPGTPAASSVGEGESLSAARDAASLERFRREHLLDRPLAVQYLDYLGPFDLSERGHPWFGGSGERPYGGLFCGDLGVELLRPGVPVAGEIEKRLAVTLPLMFCALLGSTCRMIPLGVRRRGAPGSRWDRFTDDRGRFLLVALPVFWAGVLLQTLLGARGLDLLPVLWPAGEATAAQVLAASVLPVACAAYGIAAYVSRQTRAAMIEALESDWVRTLRARGLAESRIVWRHALRNAAAPLCMHFGQVLPALAAGSVLIETIFDVPGVGTYLYRGLLQREVDIVTGVVLVSALFAGLGLLLSDLLHGSLDPRARP
ncbi:MAG: ABC transporter permease [Planctomycetes bacterium]|nr:ABC transporter permease [Planctomycetota bacterium]